MSILTPDEVNAIKFKLREYTDNGGWEIPLDDFSRAIEDAVITKLAMANTKRTNYANADRGVYGPEYQGQQAQCTTEEPKLPVGKAISCMCPVCGEWQRSTESGMVCKNGHGGVTGINHRAFTYTQMQEHYNAGYRAGVGYVCSQSKTS